MKIENLQKILHSLGGQKYGVCMSASARSTPIGKTLSIYDLPKDTDVRWTAHLKVLVVFFVEVGDIAFEEVSRRYNLSAEEFRSWKRRYSKDGLKGLRETRIQQYSR